MRRFAVAAMLCVLAMGAVGAQEVRQASPKPPSAESQSDTGSNKPPTQPQGVPPAPIIVNVQLPTRAEVEVQKEERERQEKASLDRRLVELTGDLADYTKWLAYATAALFAVTAGLFAFAVLQARDAKRAGRDSRRSADAAARSADLAERALGGAEPPYLYPIVQAASVIEVPDFPHPEGLQSIIGLKVTNFGRSPALLQAYLTVFGPSRAIPPIDAIGGGNIMRINAAVRDSETIMLHRIGVANGIEKSTVDGQFPPHEWMLMLHGYIIYSDLAGDMFVTRYCYNYVRHRRTFFAIGGENKNHRQKLTADEVAEVRRQLSD